MELWIRSQDKELLVLAKGFELQNPSYNGGCQIFAVWQNNYQCVGNYKSKERALEVLDEINKLLMPTIEYNPVVKKEESWEEEYQRTILKGYNVKIEQAITYVYEMPKE